MISIECPSCNRRLKCPDEAAGKSATCPHCQTAMRIPQLPEQSTEEPAAEQPIDIGAMLQQPPIASEPLFDPSESRQSVVVPARFANCRRYVNVLSSATNFVIGLSAIAPLAGVLMVSLVLAKRDPELRTQALLICGGALLVWWVILFWIRTCILCGLELIQVAVEIEHNGRTASAWLDRLCNKQSS